VYSISISLGLLTVNVDVRYIVLCSFYYDYV